MFKKSCLGLTVLVFISFFISATNIFAASITNSYAVNQTVPRGGSLTRYVPITGAPSNAVITNVEAKFSYIAYNGVQNYVSARFNRGPSPDRLLQFDMCAPSVLISRLSLSLLGLLQDFSEAAPAYSLSLMTLLYASPVSALLPHP